MKKTVTLEMQNNPQNIYMRIHHDNYLGTPIFHNHTFYEFMLIEKGVINQVFNDNVIQLKQNDLCIVPPETCHSICGAGVSPTVFYNFEVSKKFINEYLTAVGKPINYQLLNSPFLVIKYSNSEMKDFMQLLNHAVKQNSTEQENMFYLKTIICHALYRLISHSSYDNNKKFKNPIINDCLTALNDIKNFSYPVKTILSNKGYCHEHITRLFKKEGLSTPVNILLKNKLEYARILLSSSDLKIVDITQLCGFYSSCYFHQMFKKYYSVSPSEYRKRYQ